MAKRYALIAFRGARTQREMADRFGVSVLTWKNWEHGRTVPHKVFRRRLAEEAGRPEEELFPSEKMECLVEENTCPQHGDSRCCITCPEKDKCIDCCFRMNECKWQTVNWQ